MKECEAVSLPGAGSARVGTPPGSTSGDCFAYALARVMGEALLYMGDDFSRTDIRDARGPS
jgi:uncharacterized protein with PIN domain